jgi:hypothetical protein
MQLARESPAWINTRLEFEIAAAVRKLRIDRRLKHLLAELMKFRITEDVFFQQKERKAGEVMEAPLGPYKFMATGGGLKRVPQFEVIEMAEEPQKIPTMAGVTVTPITVTPLPPVQPMPTVAPDTTDKASLFAQRLAKFHQHISDKIDAGNALLDGGEPLADKALTSATQKIQSGIDQVQEVLNVLKQLPGSNV